ncbi:MAG: cytochrome c-type biogenesis protein [Pseudomonadota bacterium]
MKQFICASLIAVSAMMAVVQADKVSAQDSSSAIMPFDFRTDAERLRYQHFSKVLRCPMCQNQNLNGSNAGISTDLRRELYRLISEDYTDQQIIDFMKSRYGNFILYEPPINKATSVLWFTPILLLLLGLVILVSMVRRQTAEIDEVGLSTDELDAVRQELLGVHHGAGSAQAEHDKLSRE